MAASTTARALSRSLRQEHRWGLRFKHSPGARRAYSIAADEPALSKLPDVDPSKLQISRTLSPKALMREEELVFGRTFTGPLWFLQ